jgi:PEP-CTERM motif
MKRIALFTALLTSILPGGVITTYDRATFQSASLTAQNFDGLANGAALGTTAGVTYGASDGSVVVTSTYLTTTGSNGIGSTSTTGPDCCYFFATESVTLSFASAITAFAIDINTFDLLTAGYNVTLNTGDIIQSGFDVFPSARTGQFIGFTSDMAFTSLVLRARSGGFSYTLDTMRFGTAAAVVAAAGIPEPGTWALIGSGLGLLLLRRRAR